MKTKIFMLFLVLMLLVIPVYSSYNTRQINVEYGIRIAINGKYSEMKDVNEKTVYPFVYEGTTYVPIRGVSQLLGSTVWYDATNDVAHIETPEETSSNVSPLEHRSIYDFFNMLIKAERCIDEYDYIDHNINGILYTYYLDEDAAVDYIDELRDKIKELKNNELKEIHQWALLNRTDYDYELSLEIYKFENNLSDAFDNMDRALSSLDDYITCMVDSDIFRNSYYDRFERYLEDAREDIISADTWCEAYIDANLIMMESYLVD